jgi:transposase-like protein
MNERYQRSEQALVLAMIKMVINGVSTREIEMVTEELCGKSFSKSMVYSLCQRLDPVVKAFRNRPLKKRYPFLVADAIYLKVCEDGRVRSKGLLIAFGMNEDGHREVIGFKLADSESEASWGDFFAELKDRGLESIDLITSDDHKGLVKAIRKHFQGAAWQRCQTHFSRNVLDKAPKKRQPELKQSLNRIYNAKDEKEARRCFRKPLKRLEPMRPRQWQFSRKVLMTSSPSRACRKNTGKSEDHPTVWNVSTKRSAAETGSSVFIPMKHP